MAFYGEYIPVGERRARAQRETEKLRGEGKSLDPVVIEGRALAKTFWGKRWCGHLESFSDFTNRLPRGRTYARNGSVCHLEVSEGHVEALVYGSSMYKVEVDIEPLDEQVWNSVKAQCVGRIATMLELLAGQFSDQVMEVVAHRHEGLYPLPREIRFRCNCPDGVRMCKHIAAVLYGVGNRLDSRPELLFLLRGVDPEELLGAPLSLPSSGDGEDHLEDDRLADIFGIEFDEDVAGPS